MLNPEQFERAAQNLYGHETGGDRDEWSALNETEKQHWRDKTLAKLGDYANMNHAEREMENRVALGVTLNPSAAPRREDAAGAGSNAELLLMFADVICPKLRDLLVPHGASATNWDDAAKQLRGIAAALSTAEGERDDAERERDKWKSVASPPRITCRTCQREQIEAATKAVGASATFCGTDSTVAAPRREDAGDEKPMDYRHPLEMHHARREDAAGERLDQLANLEWDWDSYGSPPIGKRAIDCARRLMVVLSRPPQIVPTSHGGVQLEWHREGVEVEITIPPEGGTEFYVDGER